MIRTDTSWWTTPSLPTTKCAQVPGSSCNSASGRSGANVLRVAVALDATATCSTITRGFVSRYDENP